MTQRRSLWRLAALCVLMALAATGCFQEAGDKPQSTQISQFIPTATSTDTPIPSPTDIPTQTIVAQQVLVTETPTPTETPTLTATPTAADQLVSDIVNSTKVAQADDEFVLTATQYVLEITQTQSFSETQTAIALGIGATETPIPFFTPTAQIPVFSTATPFGTGGVQQPVNPGGVCIHEVRLGDTMFRLSMLYGVSVADLAAANGITNPQLILVGQKVNIPGCGTTGVFPPPTSQPTQAFDASAQFGTGGTTLGPVVQVQTSDGQIVQGQLVNSGQGGGTTFAGTTHVVQQYETLFQISQQYGVSVTSIAAANGIANINRIIMGDTLVIPAQ